MRAYVLVVAVVALVAGGCSGAGTRHVFYRRLREGAEGGGGARRLFGGRAAPLERWGGVCALLDRYWAARCSGTVVAPRWALTAAHCVSSRLAYVLYNTRVATGTPHGDAAPVHLLYRHPGYRVVEEDEGRGSDVTLLHHDVGLVRTRADMNLRRPPSLKPLQAMLLYDPYELTEKQVEVLGFGRSEHSKQGEQLLTTRLVLAGCERGTWMHCMCGRGGEGGVCTGDSGGPVVYRNAQVAVTSMGPAECSAGDAGVAGPFATSVFTALRQYVPLLNETIAENDAALRMVRLSAAPGLRPARLLPSLCLCLYLYTNYFPYITRL